jgi:hypothetical protein
MSSIVQLKLQKRLLEEKLQNTDARINRLGDILVRKTVKNPHLLQPEENALTDVGRTVSEFRRPPSLVKAIPKEHRPDAYHTMPVPVTNERILAIRQTYQLHTTARSEVQRRIQEKKERELRSVKKEKQHPKITVPESMLPNRYLRGELPCTIGNSLLSIFCILAFCCLRTRWTKCKILKLGLSFRKFGL